MRFQITILTLGLVFDVFIAGLIVKQKTSSNEPVQSEVLAYQTQESPLPTAYVSPEPSVSPSSIPEEKKVLSKEDTSNEEVTEDSKETSVVLAATSTPKIEPTPTPAAVVATPTPQPTATPNITAPDHLEPIFDRYAAEYGVDKNLLKSVAKCESSFNPGAVNGPYAGMYQYSEGRWIENRQIMGLDPNPELRYNAEEAIKTAAFFMVRGGITMWPNCH